jgi:hypothetical protein
MEWELLSRPLEQKPDFLLLFLGRARARSATSRIAGGESGSGRTILVLAL